MNVARVFVDPQRSVPDFRLAISFLWGDAHNVDSDGDACSPASRDWTELYLCSRERTEEVVEVFPGESSKILVVESPITELACRLAFFLATETGGAVSTSEAGPWEDPTGLLAHVGDFSIEEAIARAASSPFRKASLDDPYPNLRG